MYAPIKTNRIAVQIVAQVEGLIRSGQLSPGDQLATERDLAEQFSVSRTAVREAISALVQRGLIEVRPGRGTFVVDRTAQVVGSSLQLMVQVGQQGALHNIVEVREILEPEIAARAAQRADKAHIEAIWVALEELDAVIGDADGFVAADTRFHLALAAACGNDIIVRLLDSIVDMLVEQRRQVLITVQDSIAAQQHHRLIVAAIVARDPQAARQAMQEHMRKVRQDSERAGS